VHFHIMLMITCGCIQPFYVKRRNYFFTKSRLIYKTHWYVFIVYAMHFSVPPIKSLIVMSYLPPKCEHISKRAVELGLMPMATCCWLKPGQLDNNYNLNVISSSLHLILSITLITRSFFIGP
jgi:hypothetical protein